MVLALKRALNACIPFQQKMCIMYAHLHNYMCIHIYVLMDRQKDRQTDKQANRQTDKQNPILNGSPINPKPCC